MTDNRTDELREKLTKCGVKWRAREEELGVNLDCFHDTRWDVNEVLWCFTELGDITCLTMCNEWKGCTPEQAIAATLGSELNPDGLPNGLTISDDNTLLNWRGENYVKQIGNTLTAEQVSKAVYAHSIHADCADADWQAIADELNSGLRKVVNA